MDEDGINETRPKELKAEDFKTLNGCCVLYVVQQRSSYAKEKYQAYVNAEMELLYALYYLADRYASYNLYENFFVKAVELMRKSAKGTADLKYYMVWALLAMGRDEEAYDVRLHSKRKCTQMFANVRK